MSARGEHLAPLITLKGLLSFLVSCPKLREVGLTLDVRDVPSGAYTDVCNPSVSSIIPIKHPDLVAEFLLKHPPSVPGVFFSWCGRVNDYLEYEQLWLQVDKRIGHPDFS